MAEDNSLLFEYILINSLFVFLVFIFSCLMYSRKIIFLLKICRILNNFPILSCKEKMFSKTLTVNGIYIYATYIFIPSISVSVLNETVFNTSEKSGDI